MRINDEWMRQCYRKLQMVHATLINTWEQKKNNEHLNLQVKYLLATTHYLTSESPQMHHIAAPMKCQHDLLNTAAACITLKA